MDAHVVHAGVAIGMACVSELWGCGCGVRVRHDSSSLNFLVKYTLVSARNAMVGSAGLLGVLASSSSIMLLSHSLKKSNFFQDGESLLFFSSLWMVHISSLRLLIIMFSQSSFFVFMYS